MSLFRPSLDIDLSLTQVMGASMRPTLLVNTYGTRFGALALSFPCVSTAPCAAKAKKRRVGVGFWVGREGETRQRGRQE